MPKSPDTYDVRHWSDDYDNGATLRLGEEALGHIQDAFDGINLQDLPEGQVRVLRLLVYEGDKADVARVLGRSLADGCRDEKTYRIHALTIRSSRVKSTADRAAAAGAVGALRTVLGWLRERGPQEDLDLRVEALLAEINAAWKG